MITETEQHKQPSLTQRWNLEKLRQDLTGHILDDTAFDKIVFTTYDCHKELKIQVDNYA